MPAVTRARSGRTTGGAGPRRSSRANTMALVAWRSREGCRRRPRPGWRRSACATAITGPRSAQTLYLTSHLAARELAGVDVAVHRTRAESSQQIRITDAGHVGGLETTLVQLPIEGATRDGAEVRARARVEPDA